MLPADDGEGGFARSAEATGLVRDPLRRVCDNRSGGGRVSQRELCSGGSGVGGLGVRASGGAVLEAGAQLQPGQALRQKTGAEK